MWKKYGYLRHEIMMPSEFNYKFGIKPLNMKYFRNAEKKIKEELRKYQDELQNESEGGEWKNRILKTLYPMQ